jgi:AICAR transformylase/IMP cyclohydrolase PurH
LTSGGVTLLRAAAKNHGRVTVVCDPADYEKCVESFVWPDNNCINFAVQYVIGSNELVEVLKSGYFF